MDNFKYKGLAVLILATLLHASTGIFFRLIGGSFDLFFQAGARALIMFFMVLLVLMWQGNWKAVKRGDRKWFVAMGILDTFVFLFMFMAFNHLTIGTALFLFYASATIGGYILGQVIFQEKLNATKIMSLFFCLGGLAIIYSFSVQEGKAIYLILAFLSGCFIACWNNFSKKISGHYPASQIFLIDTGIVFILAMVFSIYFKETYVWPDLSLRWLLLLGFAVMNVGAVLFTIYGFKHMPAQVATVTMLLEIVFGIILAWIFFTEIPNGSSVLGGLLILFGVALPNFKQEELLSEQREY